MRWAAVAVAVAFLLAALVWVLVGNLLPANWGAATSLGAAGATLALAGWLGAPRRQPEHKEAESAPHAHRATA
jgi:VIT1/CCC1 family predicted Fe2+/Mn2+ transporter